MRGRILILAGLLALGLFVLDGAGGTAGVDLVGTAAAPGFCGGGEPGEPCSCPGQDPIFGKELPIYC